MKTSRSALAALAATVLVLMLSACWPGGTPSADPSDTPTTPVETVVPEETETPEPEGLDEDDYANILAAIETGNTAAIESYLSNPVNFIIAASECCGPVTPVEAIANLDYAEGGADPWTVTPEGTVDVYRTGFYVDYFPEGAFVVESADADPMVISFTIAGDEITGIFISAGASLLMP